MKQQLRYWSSLSHMVEKIDRQAEFSGTKQVPENLAIDIKTLNQYLAAHVPGFSEILEFTQFKGGQSNPTYLVTTASGRYVLRRKPPGTLLPSAHAIDREFRVISALHQQGFPVPQPYILCEDETIAGTAFYLMAFNDGPVMWEPHLPEATVDQRRAIYKAMNTTIAQLHIIDINKAGLSDFGRPSQYVARQIKRWSGQYRQSTSSINPDMNRLMEWLPEALPAEEKATLVHGDFRLDNLILTADKSQIAAVLDWELSTLGDPLADFTYHLMQWKMPPSKTGAGTGSLANHDLEALGIPDLETYVEHYCQQTGRENIENLNFYFAYNFFRLAAILQGIVGRVRDGTATNTHAGAMASRVPPLAKCAWQYAVLAGAGS